MTHAEIRKIGITESELQELIDKKVVVKSVVLDSLLMPVKFLYSFTI